MKQDEIIEMVRIAEDKVIANQNLDWKIEFAKLVAAKEREACAKVCEEDAFVEQWKGLAEATKRIRARGEA